MPDRRVTWYLPASGEQWPDDYERGRPGWPLEVVRIPGLPSAATVLDDVEMNAAGFPTNEGILTAAGVKDSYDTHIAGIIAVDDKHPDCSLAYSPNTGTSTVHYAADGANC